MKAVFISEDPKEINRWSKADDMANFIWELVMNGWRDFKHTDYDYSPAWEKINKLLEEYHIDVDELM